MFLLFGRLDLDDRAILAVFTVLYGALAVVELFLTFRYARQGAPPVAEPSDVDGPDRPLTFAY